MVDSSAWGIPILTFSQKWLSISLSPSPLTSWFIITVVITCSDWRCVRTLWSVPLSSLSLPSWLSNHHSCDYLLWLKVCTDTLLCTIIIIIITIMVINSSLLWLPALVEGVLNSDLYHYHHYHFRNGNHIIIVVSTCSGWGCVWTLCSVLLSSLPLSSWLSCHQCCDYLLWLKVCMDTLIWLYLRRSLVVSSSVLKEFIRTSGTSTPYTLFRFCTHNHRNIGWRVWSVNYEK